MPDFILCGVCGFICDNSDNLAEHMKNHAGFGAWQEQMRERQLKHRLEQVRGEEGDRERLLKYRLEKEREQEWWAKHPLNPLNRGMSMMSLHQEDVFGVPTTTYTQYTEYPNGTTFTVSTVNSSRGTAIVTTAQRPTSQITMTTASQASGSFTSLGPKQHNNDCALCLEPLSDKETRTTLCNHTFHKNCLLELSKKSNTRTPYGFPCPFCRQAITYDWLKS